jgi:hypothetical protein
MKNARLEVLKKIAKEAELKKQAQQVVETVDEQNIEDSKQFANQIFEELLNRLSIPGLDE